MVRLLKIVIYHARLSPCLGKFRFCQVVGSFSMIKPLNRSISQYMSLFDQEMGEHTSKRPTLRLSLHSHRIHLLSILICLLFFFSSFIFSHSIPSFSHSFFSNASLFSFFSCNSLRTRYMSDDIWPTGFSTFRVDNPDF